MMIIHNAFFKTMENLSAMEFAGGGRNVYEAQIVGLLAANLSQEYLSRGVAYPFKNIRLEMPYLSSPSKNSFCDLHFSLKILFDAVPGMFEGGALKAENWVEVKLFVRSEKAQGGLTTEVGAILNDLSRLASLPKRDGRFFVAVFAQSPGDILALNAYPEKGAKFERSWITELFGGGSHPFDVETRIEEEAKTVKDRVDSLDHARRLAGESCHVPCGKDGYMGYLISLH